MFQMPSMGTGLKLSGSGWSDWDQSWTPCLFGLAVEKEKESESCRDDACFFLPRHQSIPPLQCPWRCFQIATVCVSPDTKWAGGGFDACMTSVFKADHSARILHFVRNRHFSKLKKHCTMWMRTEYFCFSCVLLVLMSCTILICGRSSSFMEWALYVAWVAHSLYLGNQANTPRTSSVTCYGHCGNDNWTLMHLGFVTTSVCAGKWSRNQTTKFL